MCEYTDMSSKCTYSVPSKAELDRIYDKYRRMRLENKEQYSVFNAAMASTVIAESACERKQSIGSHYIIDS